MKHGLEHIAFYVQKQKAPWAICYNHLLVCDMPLGAPDFVRLIYLIDWLTAGGQKFGYRARNGKISENSPNKNTGEVWHELNENLFS